MSLRTGSVCLELISMFNWNVNFLSSIIFGCLVLLDPIRAVVLLLNQMLRFLDVCESDSYLLGPFFD